MEGLYKIDQSLSGYEQQGLRFCTTNKALAGFNSLDPEWGWLMKPYGRGERFGGIFSR